MAMVGDPSHEFSDFLFTFLLSVLHGVVSAFLPSPEGDPFLRHKRRRRHGGFKVDRAREHREKHRPHVLVPRQGLFARADWWAVDSWSNTLPSRMLRSCCLF